METLDLASVAGVALATVVIVQASLPAIGLPTGSPGRARFGPFVAVLVATVLAVIAAFATAGSPLVGLEVGITAGGFAIGVHDLGSSAGIPI